MRNVILELNSEIEGSHAFLCSDVISVFYCISSYVFCSSSRCRMMFVKMVSEVCIFVDA